MANQTNLGTPSVGIDSGHDSPRNYSGQVIAISSVYAGGTAAAKIGDIVINSDGHSGTIVGGSGTVYIEGVPAARLGDPVAGVLTGTIIGGETTIQTG